MAQVRVYNKRGRPIRIVARDRSYLPGFRGKSKKSCPRMWSPIAEHLNLGERHRRAAARGLKEETHSHIIINPSELYDLGIELRVTVASSKNFTDNQIQMHYTFPCDLTPEALARLNKSLRTGENSEVRYFPLDQIGQPPITLPISNRDLGRIEKVIRNYQQSLRQDSKDYDSDEKPFRKAV